MLTVPHHVVVTHAGVLRSMRARRRRRAACFTCVAAGAVLVTGGAGFIGSAAALELLRRKRDVVLLDAFTERPYPRAWKHANMAALHAEAAANSCRLWELSGDCASRDDVARAFAAAPVSHVLHLAAVSGLSAGVRAEDVFSANVSATCVVLDAAVQHGVASCVLASSASVYGDDGGDNVPRPFAETHPAAAPLSVYAASKRSAELAAHALSAASALSCRVLRLFTIYGPRGRPDMAPYRFLRDICAGRALTVYGGGTAWRDYVYIDDAVDALLAALLSAPPSVPGVDIVNVCSGAPIRLHEFIAAVEAVTDAKATLHRLRDRAGDVGGTLGDTRKAQRVLGWRARVDLHEGLRRTAAWWRSSDADAYRDDGSGA